MKGYAPWLIAVVPRLAIGLLLAALLAVELFGLAPEPAVAACRELLLAVLRRSGS